jgi:hypothetical protein
MGPETFSCRNFSAGGSTAMMGAKIRNFAPLPDLSLEELVPKDNFYRRPATDSSAFLNLSKSSP